MFFRREISCKVKLCTKTISVSRSESLEIRLFYRKLSSRNEEFRQVHSTEILFNTATIREVNSTEIDPFLLKLAYKWVCLRKFVIELAYYAPSTNHRTENLTSERASNSDTRQERCIKEQIYFELLYVSFIYFTS